MLEGLEISEVKLSKIGFENKVFRIDAEYFRKQFLREDLLRIKYQNCYLGENSFITDGQHGYHEVDESSEISHLTAKNFKNWFANTNNADRLAKWVDENNKRSSLQVNDIVLTTRGTVGYCAIVKQEVLPANIDQDVARIAIDENSKINPQYLVSYINSRFGQDWTKRNQTGMVQQGLALWRVEEFPIPVLNKFFQNKISELVEVSYNSIISSKKTYKQAENILLETLGLKDFAPSREKVNVKSFKDSFLKSGRLDAEYYQIKYDEIESKLEQLDYIQIKDVFDLLSNPSPNKYLTSGTKVIKTKNIRIPSIEFESITDHTIDECLKVKQNDILFASMGVGSLGRVSYIDSDIKNCTIDGTIKVLRIKDVWKNHSIEIPVMLFLTSKLGQELIYKYIIGSTGIISISKFNIANLIIPEFDNHSAKKMSRLVLESINFKKQSEQLLQLAKNAVEKAIEEGEESAMSYINEHLDTKE